MSLFRPTDDIKGFARDPADLCRMFLVAAEELERHAGVCLIEQGQEWHSSPAQRAAAGCQLPSARYIALFLTSYKRIGTINTTADPSTS
jgi:hypothetical protein